MPPGEFPGRQYVRRAVAEKLRVDAEGTSREAWVFTEASELKLCSGWQEEKRWPRRAE